MRYNKILQDSETRRAQFSWSLRKKGEWKTIVVKITSFLRCHCTVTFVTITVTTHDSSESYLAYLGYNNLTKV